MTGTRREEEDAGEIRGKFGDGVEAEVEIGIDSSSLPIPKQGIEYKVSDR